MAGEVKALEFAEGTIVLSAPTTFFISSSGLLPFASDAAFVVSKGSAAVEGDAYANTTDHTMHYYDGSAWLSYGSSFIGLQEVPVGLVNGINTDYTISSAPIDATVVVLRDGLKVPVAQYSFAHPVVSFVTAPAIGQLIEVSYLTNGTSATRTLNLTNQIVENRLITVGEMAAKKLTLANTPGVPTEVICDMASGSIQIYGLDFNIINGNQLNWSALGMDGVVLAGTYLRIVYYI
jgi:hypothetical protein